jgi:AbrB family looped-hinge helix DNA binding protein
MRATLTSKGQITIPSKIRERLGLKPGQILDFDEDVPYLKVTPVFDEAAMRSVIGCEEAKLGLAAKEWLEETPRSGTRGMKLAIDRGYYRKYFPALSLLTI